jgi:O-antigen ligase
LTYKSRPNSSLSRAGWSLPLGSYVIPALVTITAVVIGMVVGQGQWPLALMALCVPLLLLYPVQLALGAFALLIPFDSIAVLGDSKEGRTITWFAGAAAACVLFGTGLAARRFKSMPRESIWWIAFALWCVITSVWAIDPDTSLHQLPTTFALLGLYVASSCFHYRKSELQTIMLSSILGGCAAALWTVYMFRQGNFFEAGSTRASLIVGDRTANPDGVAMTMILPIALAFGYFLSSKTWRVKAIMLLAIGLSTLALFVTMSRGAVVALGVTLLIFFYRLGARSKLLVPILLLGSILAFMPAIFFVRFQQATENGGAGRLDIWRVGLAAFSHYGIFGAGFHNFPFAYTKYAGEATHFKGIYRDPHNIYLGMAVETGIVGLFFFGSAIRAQLRAASRLKDRLGANNWVVAAEASAWGLLAFGFFGNIIWDKSFWFAWMLVTATVSYSAQTYTTDG